MIHPMIDHQIYGSVTVNTKWQIIIPKEAREALGIKAGDRLLVTSKWKCVLWLIKASNVQEFVDKMQKNLD
jgi:AbrB family looped-hinge helix DNA binding protein